MSVDEIRRKKLKGIKIVGDKVFYQTKAGKIAVGSTKDLYWCRSSKKGWWSRKDDSFDLHFHATKIPEKMKKRYGHTGDVKPIKGL